MNTSDLRLVYRVVCVQFQVQSFFSIMSTVIRSTSLTNAVSGAQLQRQLSNQGSVRGDPGAASSTSQGPGHQLPDARRGNRQPAISEEERRALTLLPSGQVAHHLDDTEGELKFTTLVPLKAVPEPKPQRPEGGLTGKRGLNKIGMKALMQHYCNETGMAMADLQSRRDFVRRFLQPLLVNGPNGRRLNWDQQAVARKKIQSLYTRNTSLLFV